MVNLGDLSWPATWEAFQKAVEAGASSDSFKLIDGKPFASLGDIPEGSEPNLKLLSDLLRSSAPLTDKIRYWLADMLDPDVHCEVNLKAVRRPGAKAKGPVAHWEAVLRFRDLNGNKGDRKRAIHEVTQEFGMSSSTLEDAIARLKPDLDEMDRANAEEFLSGETRWVISES